jgi:hypothetical protein
MVAAHDNFAFRFRDKLISNASATSDTLKSLKSGHRLRAAFLDFAGNLLLGAAPNTAAGLSVVLPFPMAAFRGWVGGVVSADNNHESRLAHLKPAIYYLTILILQLVPYTLAAGAGVQLGLRSYRSWDDPAIKRWWFLPRTAAIDVLWIYSLVVPLFLLASLVEFAAA